MGWRDKWHLKWYRYLIKNHWNSSHPSCSSEAIVCLNHPQLWMGQLNEHIYDSDCLLKINHSSEDLVIFIAPTAIRVFLLCLREFLWSLDWWIYYDLHHRGNHDVNSQGEEKKNLLLLDRIAFQSTHLSWKDMNGSNNIYCACTARFEVANAVVV